MINVHFVIVGAVLGLTGAAFYIRDTLRGITHPNRVSWLLWGAAPMLAFAVEVRSGVGLRSLMTFTVGFAPLLVVAASFVGGNAVWRLTRLDIVCGSLSVAGTAVWLLTRQGLVAIAAAILADALAGVPTIVKSWLAPETESVSAYLGAFANATITLLTVTTVSVVVVAFPIYIVLIAGLEVVLIAGRLGPRVRSWRGVSATGPGPPSRLPTSRDRARGPWDDPGHGAPPGVGPAPATTLGTPVGPVPVTRFAALLRGVNVSGHRKVSMADLRSLVEGLGFADVETYRQSGNVVFATTLRSAGRAASALEEALRDELGYDDVDVLVRGPTELARLALENPFLAAGAEPASCHVTFLKDLPAGGAPDDHQPGGTADGFAFTERAVYVHCPNGYGRTKFNNGYFEKQAGVRATTRNWATVLALSDLTAGR